jgi:hypothetical protein
MATVPKDFTPSGLTTGVVVVEDIGAEVLSIDPKVTA